MPKVEINQKVKQFSDEDTSCIQGVVIDTDDECEPWMIISHCGNEISLSLDNWDSLLNLVERAKLEALR